MKKIPYGICNYRTLIEDDYVYVDKTMFLEKLEDVGRTLIYLRPGRFGKTLFTSMMYYYYDVKSEYLFDTLFKDTYVYEHPTSRKNSYYILKLDFSGMDTSSSKERDLEKTFKKCLEKGINEFLSKYKIFFDKNYDCTVTDLMKDFLSSFYQNNLKNNLENKMYIIIDEYDNFTNAILEGTGEDFKKIVGNNGFVKAFYACIKEYVGLGVVDRVFITGICPITMDSMTTGFNIATDISRHINFTTMIGLTHEEVKFLLEDVEEEKQEELYNLMIDNYDGYLFNKNETGRSFNATLVMYFLKNYYDLNKIPEQLIDTNIAFNFGKVENLIKLYDNNYYKDILNYLFTNDEVSGILKEKFNLEYDFTKDDIISLLYYFGYLTIEKGTAGGIIFKIPNYVMKGTYANYFIHILSKTDINIASNKRSEYSEELANTGGISILSHYIEEVLEKLDNRTFIKFDERYIQLLYFSLLINNPNFKVYTEYSTSNGYIDVMIFKNSDLSKYDIMIELKYLKKNEYRRNKKLLEEKRNEAIKQLNSYSLDDRISKDNLRKYVVIFVGNKLKVLEEV